MRVVLVLLLGFTVSIVACSSDKDGGEGKNTGGTSDGNGATTLTCKYSNCPKEVVVYDRQEQCDALMASVCYPKHKEWIDCKLSNEQCTAEGKTDAMSVASCKSLLNALNDCIAANPM